jgi:hypothetical protein
MFLVRHLLTTLQGNLSVTGCLGQVKLTNEQRQKKKGAAAPRFID